MIYGIPALPQLTGTVEVDVKILYVYLTQLNQSLIESSTFAGDVSVEDDDVVSFDVSVGFNEPEQPLEPFMVQGVQGVQGPSGQPGFTNFDSTEVQGIELPVQNFINRSNPFDVAFLWPVGSVFISVVSTNPAAMLGFGTWTAFGTGRVLVGLNSSDTDFDTVEETGGAKTVVSTGTVSQPTFTGSALLTHIHNADGTLAAAAHAGVYNQTVDRNLDGATVVVSDISHVHDITGDTSATSAGTPAGTVSQPTFTGSATSVVQPYIVVYMWKRTA